MKGFKKFKNLLENKPLNSNLENFINLQTKFSMINKKKLEQVDKENSEKKTSNSLFTYDMDYFFNMR